MIGRTVSHYKVLEEVSRGGMGIVYRAMDLKLEREVALKVLPPELVSNAERKRRFVQEAKAAAALNHPHIATVFEIDEADGTTFIAMELIKGEKLRDVLEKNPLPLSHSLTLAMEIAEGLSRAHEKGIVHRDLKPANIMVTEDDHAKIIDFGLAKLVEPLEEAGSDVETALRGETDSGKVLGTVSYMSPEQARGRKVDHRTDIFSLGIVLYEMLTGEAPFRGGSGADTLSAILKDPTPRLPSMGPKVPEDLLSSLQSIVDRCLAKQPEERYLTARILLSELRRVKADLDRGGSTRVGPARRIFSQLASQPYRASVVVGLVLLAGILGYLLRPPREKPKEPVPRLTNALQITTAIGVEDYPTWSPDGRTLAYSAAQRGDPYGGNWDIWVTQLGSVQPVNRTADHLGADRFPSWSTDGTRFAFWSEREGGGYFVMSALGGTPQKVTSADLLIQPSPPQWSADASELACVVKDAKGSFVEMVSLRSGASRRLALPGRKTDRFDLSWSPDGRYFAYVDANDLNNDVTQLWVLRVADGQGLPLTDGWTCDWSPSWSADGRTLYFVSNRGGSMDLWQQPLRPDGSLEGASQPITSGIVMRQAVFSPDGTKLAYSRGRREANLWRVPILADRPATWTDAEQLSFDHAFIEYTDVSADGERLVVSSDRAGNPDIWMLPADGGEMVQLTTDRTPDWAPRWSPDGEAIVFYSYRTGNRDVWVKSRRGGPARQISRDEAEDTVPTWSPDGREIAFASNRSGNFDLWIVSAEGGVPRQITNHPAVDDYPHWSPDGKWIVFLSNRTGASRLWRVPVAGGDPVPLTAGSAIYPRWSGDGKQVFFTGTGEKAGNIWAISVESGAERPLTNLAGKYGSPGIYNLAAARQHLFFAWEENLGDLWVMDVARKEPD